MNNQALHIVINGHPYVKKNQGKVVGIGKKTRKINSPQYNSWHSEAKRQFNWMGYNAQFKEEKKLNPELEAIINFPVNVQMKFFLKRNMIVDMSNLYEGILDTLVEVGILKDDSWHIVASHDGSGVAVDKERPRIEITITPKEQRDGQI